MKRIYLSFVVLLVVLSNLSAQYNQDEILKEMQKMQKEMLKQFENLEFNFGDSQLFIDTFFIKEFEHQDDWLPLEPNAESLSGMMELLQKQMQEMDQDDWAEIEKLFKPFDGFSPIVPAPEKLDEGKKEEDITKKLNKKRKVYSL
jgi:hypothetical protein